MRVAMIDPSLFTLPYDAALAGGLQQEGHEVVLYGRAPTRDDNAIDGVPLEQSFYRLAGGPLVAPLPRAVRLAVKGLDHVWSMRVLLQALRRLQPDVIHFQWAPLPIIDRMFLRALRQIAPIVLTVHDTNPFNGNPTGRLQRLGAHDILSGFDRLIVHTNQGRDRLVALGEPEHRVVLMPHGLLGVSPGTATADPMTGTMTFAQFGKMKPYKGIDLLIEAFAGLPPEVRRQSRLRLVGKPYMDLGPLQHAAEAHGIAHQVTFEPRFVSDDDVPDVFSPGTVAAFPYREIEASGVLGLAITFGRPILASRIGSFGETVQDGRHGLLFPPGDVAALRAAMERLIADRAFAAACAAAVQAMAVAVPTWREIGRRTAALYADVRQAAAA